MSSSTYDLDTEFTALMGGVAREIEVSRRNRIFCNRNLRMEFSDLIGFDMDYTLAQYHQAKLEQLSIAVTLTKMIENRGYSEELRSLSYDPALAIRGLVVDRKLGNVFKMDRHCYVGRVFHGKRRLSKEERVEHYRNQRVRLHLPRYVWIDTLFGLPDAVMFMTLVDYFDSNGGVDSYDKLFDDIRKSIDEAHGDGALKSVIMADIGAFIQADDKLAETLHKLRSSGKRLFLLTNSYYEYTNVVMKYLLDGKRHAYPSWRNYFDYVVCGGQKPTFFTERRPFLEVDLATNQTRDKPVTKLQRGHAYQGGNIFEFEKMTGVQGERVLYVGDHIYGDILRVKKSHVWRTAMVVQELENELVTSERLEAQIKDLDMLDRRRRNLNAEIDYESQHLKALARLVEACQQAGRDDLRPRAEDAKRNSRAMLDRLRQRIRMIVDEVDALEESIENAYNPYWGAVLREGNENSRFGEQVHDYADLYTSRVSNFLLYSPLRYFRAPRQQMPHEV
jgi:HAD superfamily 5'-nucleotidase-like hydrolase